MLGDLGIDQRGAQRLQFCKRSFLIHPHQPRVTRHVGCEDRRHPPLDMISSRGVHCLIRRVFEAGLDGLMETASIRGRTGVTEAI